MSTPTTSWSFETASDSAITVRFSDADDSVQPRFAVAYWSIRGLGAPLRMMLSAAKVDHVCHMYDIVEDGEAGWKSGYFAEKGKLLSHNAFMNLPYIVDTQEKLVLTQTNACFEYIGKQVGMMGKTDAEYAVCTQLLCELYDLRDVMVKFVYSGEDTSAATAKAAQPILAKFNAHLALTAETSGTSTFTVGDSLSAPDFHLFELLDQFDHLCKDKGLDDFLADHPHVRAFYTAFAQLKENEFYLNSILYKGFPFNNCMGQFGSAPGPATFVRGQAEVPWRNLGKVTLRPSDSA